MIRAVGLVVALLLAAALHLAVGTPVSPARLVALAGGSEPESFAEAQAVFSALPRATMAVLAGAALGVAGSLLQQVTRNPMVSPLTLGAASGAWLAIVIATLLTPALVQNHGAWVSLSGAIVAVALVTAIAGFRGLMGVQAVLAGMAVHLLFGALVSAIMLLNSPHFGHLFLWGAGDLGQSDWSWPAWMWPRVLPLLLIAALATRGLSLLRIGAEAAEGRGMRLAPFLAATVLAALGLTAISVTAVGMIGFVGLVAPNAARLGGARRPLAELLASAALGALLLLVTDALVVEASRHARDLLPTGAAVALVGAPALIWLARRQLGAEDHAMFVVPGTGRRPPKGFFAGLGLALTLTAAGALAVAPTEIGWRLDVPDALIWSLRWPRVLGAAAAGAGLAVSGAILQRLVRNPLASPDILGMSAGASLAMVMASLVLGASIHEVQVGLALGGSLAVLGLLLLLGHRQGHAPAAVALVGIALGALFDALVRVALASGTEDAFEILGWLGGSTYRISASDAVILTGIVLALLTLTIAFRRWLTLLAAGDGVALALGLHLPRARGTSMVIAAALAGVVTAFMGPITFVGLLAPHLAGMLGARRAGEQVVAAALLGALLVVASDWAARTLIYPMQLPAGTIASIVGGFYFLALLAGRRRR